MENKKLGYVLLGAALVLSGIVLYRRNGRLTALNSDGYPLRIDTEKIVWGKGIIASGIYDNGIKKYDVSVSTDANSNLIFTLFVSGVTGGYGYSYDAKGNIKEKLANNTLPPVVNENDATKDGMPYSIDVAKITKGNDNNIYYLAPNGVQYWVSNVGNDGYYLDNGMDADSPNQQYVYDLKTGAFLKIVKGNLIY